MIQHVMAAVAHRLDGRATREPRRCAPHRGSGGERCRPGSTPLRLREGRHHRWPACSPTTWHRDRTVGSRSSTDGAHGNHTVRLAGSSMLFSSTLFADSVGRSRPRERSRASARAVGAMSRARPDCAPPRSCRRQTLGAHDFDVGMVADRTATVLADPTTRLRARAPRRTRSRRWIAEPGGPMNSQACVIVGPAAGWLHVGGHLWTSTMDPGRPGSRIRSHRHSSGIEAHPRSTSISGLWRR